MNKTTSLPLYLAFCAATLAALGACSTDNKAAQTAAAPTTPQASAATPRVVPSEETVIGEARGDIDAVIESIDTNTRDITLRATNGKGYIIKVPPDVDMSRLSKGDGVILSVYQRMSMTVLAPGSAQLGMTRDVAMAQATPGQPPERAVGELTRIIAKVVAIDLENSTMTLVGSDGMARPVKLNKPESQELLKALKQDDLVQIDLLERVEVKLKPKS